MRPFEFIGTYCSSNGSLQDCLQGAYNMGLALAIALAFLMTVIGAFQYLLGAAINVKDDGKKKIIGSIYGLAIIFISGTVLYWINPNIFSAELIVFRVTNLQVPELDAQFSQEFGLSIRPTGSVSPNAPSVPPQSITAMAEFAKWSTTEPGKAAFRGSTTDATACNYFVAYVLKKSGFIGANQCVRAAGFHTFLKNRGWQEFPFDRNNIRAGDVLVRTRLSPRGYGHVAVAVASNQIAHASYGSRQPRLTGIGRNSFDVILRKQ